MLRREGEESELQVIVKVPAGVHELHVAADEAQVTSIAASYGNWQSAGSLQQYELEVHLLS